MEKCSVCKKEIEKGKIALDKDSNLLCYGCASNADKEQMIKTGKWFLYENPETKELTDWPGLFRVKYAFHSEGKHNIAGVRRDYWFKVPNDKFVWHGTCYGNNTQIVHVKRTKRTEY